MASETRKIEKFGILKLLPEDRGANNLLITGDVIQLPFSEFVNYKSNPFKSHYGFCCFMYGEYVLSMLDLQFRRQVILDRNQYIVQLAHQEFHNSKEIAGILAALWPDTTVDYPIWNCTELRFKLEPGVILQVFKSSIPMVDAGPNGIKQSDISPPGGGIPAPTPAPPEETPNDQKIPLSPPYQGQDDSGNTYVRPEGITIPPGGAGTVGQMYKVKIKYTGALGNLTEDDGPFFGPIRGVLVDQNDAGVRGILQAASDAAGTPYDFVRRTNSTPGLEAGMSLISVTPYP